MRAKVLDRVDPALPLKDRNANAISFYGQPEAIGKEVSEGSDPYPLIHVRDDILDR
jgi:hypothetical protein